METNARVQLTGKKLRLLLVTKAVHMIVWVRTAGCCHLFLQSLTEAALCLQTYQIATLTSFRTGSAWVILAPAIGGCAESLVVNDSVVQKLLGCVLAFVKTVMFFVLPFIFINCALQPLLVFALLLSRCWCTVGLLGHMF